MFERLRARAECQECEALAQTHSAVACAANPVVLAEIGWDDNAPRMVTLLPLSYVPTGRRSVAVVSRRVAAASGAQVCVLVSAARSHLLPAIPRTVRLAGRPAAGLGKNALHSAHRGLILPACGGNSSRARATSIVAPRLIYGKKRG